MADSLRQRSRALKIWLEELNRFDHVRNLEVAQQRLATRIYLVILTG
jgi:hypothetical protein